MTELMKKILLVLVVILLFVSCDRPIHEGEVVAKRYEEATRRFMLMPVAFPTGKTVSVRMIPFLIYDDEDFIVNIQKYDGEETRTRTLYVTQEVFNAVSIGSWLVVDERMDSNDPDIKERKQ